MASIKVKPGDPITADIWNELVKSAERSRVLLGGDNSRVTQTPHGSFISSKFIGGHLHPWRVVVSRKAASVYPGLLNGTTPKMKDRSSGKELDLTARPAPLLTLDGASFLNDVGWIALELETVHTDDAEDKSGNYKAIKRVNVIQCPFITSAEQVHADQVDAGKATGAFAPHFYFGMPGIGPGGYIVRYPLARLQRLGPGSFKLDQVAMFNLNWVAKPPQPSGGGTGSTATGSAAPRHFFWAT